MYARVSLLGNSLVKIFKGQRLGPRIYEFFDMSFSIRSVSNQKKLLDKFFPEHLVLVSIFHFNTIFFSYEFASSL
jgi:hypothetical protein